jgi:hypothetical protein
MFKLILFTLLITYGLCVPADDDSFKVDDFDDDWGIEDSKDPDSNNDSDVSQPEPPKGPVSYIQKIPRRGEKATTQAPVEIIPQEAEDTTVKRERRDTLTREQKKEQRRLNKKNKQNKDALAVDGVHSAIPEPVFDESQTSTKRPRKQKTHKQGKGKVQDDTLPGQHTKKQRQGSKKNKENKKDKARQDGRLPRQGKNGQRQRKQKLNKHQPTETTLQ